MLVQLNHQNCFINKLLIILRDLWLHFNCWMCFPCFCFFFLVIVVVAAMLHIGISLFLGEQNSKMKKDVLECWILDAEMCELTQNAFWQNEKIDIAFVAKEFFRMFLPIFINQMPCRGNEWGTWSNTDAWIHIYFTGFMTCYIWWAVEWFNIQISITGLLGFSFDRHIELVFIWPDIGWGNVSMTLHSISISM